MSDTAKDWLTQSGKKFIEKERSDMENREGKDKPKMIIANDGTIPESVKMGLKMLFGKEDQHKLQGKDSKR